MRKGYSIQGNFRFPTRVVKERLRVPQNHLVVTIGFIHIHTNIFIIYIFVYLCIYTHIYIYACTYFFWHFLSELSIVSLYLFVKQRQHKLETVVLPFPPFHLLGIETQVLCSVDSATVEYDIRANQVTLDWESFQLLGVSIRDFFFTQYILIKILSNSLLLLYLFFLRELWY